MIHSPAQCSRSDKCFREALSSPRPQATKPAQCERRLNHTASWKARRPENSIVNNFRNIAPGNTGVAWILALGRKRHLENRITFVVGVAARRAQVVPIFFTEGTTASASEGLYGNGWIFCRRNYRSDPSRAQRPRAKFGARSRRKRGECSTSAFESTKLLNSPQEDKSFAMRTSKRKMSLSSPF